MIHYLFVFNFTRKQSAKPHRRSGWSRS